MKKRVRGEEGKRGETEDGVGGEEDTDLFLLKVWSSVPTRESC